MKMGTTEQILQTYKELSKSVSKIYDNKSELSRNGQIPGHTPSWGNRKSK